ncbi:DUF5131 family protein [Candidatus Palauibacter sp.]|uniref:DUF5131 family protein n=1 Tax=Candidatus Palauibacter sp. TaxID=3101350 RepID=UPI003B5B00A8
MVQVPACVRFLSCEPLLGPLELDLEGIHWVIVGKQWGGRTPKAGGRLLDGREWNEYA